MPLQQIGQDENNNPIYSLPHSELVGDALHAPKPHSHGIPDIVNLQNALDGRALNSHNHDGQYAPIGSIGGGGGTPMAIVREVKPPGGFATNFPGGFAWHPRDLNSLATNGAWGISLEAKTISLPPGTYWMDWSAPSMPARSVYHALFSPSLDGFLGRYQFADFTHINQLNNDGYFAGGAMLTSVATQTVQLRGAYDYSFSGYEGTAVGLPRNVSEELYSWVKIIKLQ